jgi:diguanylate cyclase (GGDEF)-like protein
VIVFADNDHFRQLNAEFGHAAGDQVLIATAARLMAWAGPRGVVGRLGGGADEFVAATRVDPAERAACLQQLVDTLRRPVDAGGTTVEVAVSVAAASPDVLGTTDLGLLMRCADHALMTRAKHTGAAHQAVLADLDAPSVNGRLAGRPGTAASGVYAA